MEEDGRRLRIIGAFNRARNTFDDCLNSLKRRCLAGIDETDVLKDYRETMPTKGFEFFHNLLPLIRNAEFRMRKSEFITVHGCQSPNSTASILLANSFSPRSRMSVSGPFIYNPLSLKGQKRKNSEPHLYQRLLTAYSQGF